ncbi:MAG: guanosine monophosphate reductase [Candidatus Dormibacteria bacterium]
MAEPLPAPLRVHLDRLADVPMAFDYDDISLTPRHASGLPHRSDAHPDVRLGAVTLEVPMVGSPMPDVCGPEMCQALAAAGALGILHRFQSVDEEVEQFSTAAAGGRATVGAALGVTGDYRERFDALVGAGCRILCLDTANGAHEQVAAALTWARERRDDVTLIAGNVASAEAFRWLEDRGADVIRVGIAGGAVCETRTETAVFVPTPYAVAEVARVRRRALILGDSGVREPADLCKLLALGADAVMVGSALAGTGEAPGRVIVLDGKKYKIMRGAASFSVQQQAGRDEPEYVEGAETMVLYKGHVSGVIARYLAGLRSSMSYMNARTLAEYRANVDFVRLR